MNVRNLCFALVLAGMLSAVALAADIDGKWKSEMTGRSGNPQVTTYTFKAEGEKLTGTISGRQGDTPIAEGKIAGDEISFVVVRNMRGGEVKVQYKGKISGDEIKFTMLMGPDAPPREFVAKREK
jgi:hypothetical protein